MRQYVTPAMAMLVTTGVFGVATLIDNWHPTRAAVYAAVWVPTAVAIVIRTARRIDTA